MRISAYVLAADPTWIQESVGAYYQAIDSLLVSYDEDHRGWTGAPIRVEECLDHLAALDTGGRAIPAPGHFSGASEDPLVSETLQRSSCLAALRPDADWILQIDTDEFIPRTDLLLESLAVAEDRGCAAVEWPMRVLYRRLPGNRYLQVVNADGSAHFEYPGAIAMRSGTAVRSGRQATGPVLRVVVKGTATPADRTGPVWEIPESAAIWHNSWARSPRSVWSKIRSWGHNEGWRTYRYYLLRWLPAPLVWRWQRDLHPFPWGRWDRLAAAPELPDALSRARA